MSPPVSVADFIRALNFPDSQDDRDGIRALRVALEDRGLAKLIRAAQDVLTLLGQDGIYMDDLKPDRARTELWRRFAQGERGKAIAGLGVAGSNDGVAQPLELGDPLLGGGALDRGLIRALLVKELLDGLIRRDRGCRHPGSMHRNGARARPLRRIR